MATSQCTQRPAPRSILSLPDELLVEIFTAVKTYNPANGAQHAAFASSSEDIANVRLVCQRFAACSSHLLVHYVRLDGINPESLEKLEAISQHPVISKGVHIVRLVAQFYASTFADDLRQFAWYAVNTVFGQALRYKESLDEAEKATNMDDPASVERLVAKKTECVAVLERVKDILKTWSRVSADDSEAVIGRWDINTNKSDQELMVLQRRNSAEEDELEEARHMHLLHLAHGLYRLRYQKQEDLRHNDAFIQRFAAAMARMPRAKGLEIHDFVRGRYTQQEYYDFDEPPSDEYAGLIDIDSLTRPMSWDEATDRGFGEPPVEVLFRLPAAVQQAGGRLDRIALQTSTCAEHYYPLLTKASVRDVVDLGRAVHDMRLKTFIFLHQTEMKPRIRRTPAPEAMDAFDNLVTAMTNSEGLEMLWLRLDGGWADGGLDPDRRFSLGSLLLPDGDSLARWAQPPWRNLRDVHLSNFALHLSELERLAAQLRESGTKLGFLTLEKVHLLSGTWAQALELLRNVEVEWEKEITQPQGAECEDVTMMLGGRYDMVFGRWDGVRSLAEEFINGDMKHNPLKDGYTVEMVYSVDGEEVLVEVTVGDESDDLPEPDGLEDNDVVSQIVSQVV